MEFQNIPLTNSNLVDLPSPTPLSASNNANTGTPIKRFKPIETCDHCKERKVKCDKERPVCGTCKRTKRECTYEFSASSKRGRPKSELEILQEQIDDVVTIQHGQLNQLESLLEMAVKGTRDLSQTSTINLSDLIPSNDNSDGEGFLQSQVFNGWVGMHPNDVMPAPSLNQNISEETLQVSAQLAATLPKNSKAPVVHSSNINDLNQYQGINLAASDPIDQLTNEFDSLNPFESTQYIGEGSLLMLSDVGEETILPQKPTDLSQVEPELKIIPEPVAAKYMIDLYYQRVYRHYPHLRRKFVDDCLANLSKPQHFLLLNSVFFAASPFHKDEKMRDGKTYHKNHCLQTPHVLTVISLFILGLHTRTMGSAWIFHGMGSKMTFELGLHRKIKRFQMNEEIKEMRDMAFWGCFVAETWVSACYGRPSAIDEASCDVDLLPIPSDPEPDEETRLHIAWILQINLMRIFAQVRKYLYGRSKIEGTRREENQFRFLDAALGRWFYTLPQWLKFEEMAKDEQGSLLGSIGGEMHTLFWTVLILLHSLNLTMFTSSPSKLTIHTSQDSTRLSSQTICIHAATILLHWLDVLMNSVPDFFEQSCTALFSIAPAIRVLSWTAQRGDQKAESMVERLKEIKNEVKEIARRRFATGRLDGEEKLKGWLGKFKKEEEAKSSKAQDGNKMLNPDQYKNDRSQNSHKTRNPTRRRNNKSTNWNDDTDNFKFTFAPTNFNSFQESSQQNLHPYNYSDTPQHQEFHISGESTNYNSNYSELQFSNLSAPNPSSASTSPNPSTISSQMGQPSFHSPIFSGINYISPQQQQQQQQQLQNPTNIWNSPPDNKPIVRIQDQYGEEYEAKILMDNGSNLVGYSNEEYVPTF
ncbi:hypothetical protein G9A89_017505 [Geosiphon pyriformis]|nr:hypothetical protein G9A89_017505 [Geosiphon pyriformis]